MMAQKSLNMHWAEEKGEAKESKAEKESAEDPFARFLQVQNMKTGGVAVQKETIEQMAKDKLAEFEEQWEKQQRYNNTIMERKHQEMKK